MAEVREYVAIDGVRLAISRFRTRRGAPPPVIVEALPKRTDDLTAIERQPDGSSTKGRDALMRVDRRGTGSSEGIAIDESPAQERRDLVGLIAWCTGATAVDGPRRRVWHALGIRGAPGRGAASTRVGRRRRDLVVRRPQVTPR